VGRVWVLRTQAGRAVMPVRRTTALATAAPAMGVLGGTDTPLHSTVGSKAPPVEEG